MVNITECKCGKTYQLRGYVSSNYLPLFPSKMIVVSYNGIDLKFRESNFDDTKTVKISINNQFSLGKIEDRHNWIGKFELVQDGDWYYLERIEE